MLDPDFSPDSRQNCPARPGNKPTGRGFPEASEALRNNRKPGADRTSAKGRHEPGMASPDGPSAAGRDEGTPHSGARR
ncbi:hypothetical protein DJ023_07850 [Pantoea agglomerans]|nr:hypothetical protein [Pantoea agglomerans]